MANKKYPVPSKGDVFGNWTVIDPTEEYIYPNSTNLTRYTKGVLVQCPHGEVRRRSISALHNGYTTGCVRCGSEAKFNGCGELSMSYLNSVIRGADKRELEYDVTPEYLWSLFNDQDQKCALSGVEITLDANFSTNSHNNTKKYTQTASLDRINNNKGYIEGNVQWVHKQVNFMKADLDQDQFLDLCDLISKTKHAEPRTWIIGRTSVEGIHRWKKCPIDEVDYLRNYHRHVFYIVAKAYVSHADRDIEFIQLSHSIKAYLTEKYFSEQHRCLMFGDMSCEMIADELVRAFDLYECEVNEDGEGGSIVKNI